MGRRVRAYIGLGANVGDARSTLAAAVASLADLRGSVLRGVSRLYRTTPVGVTDQPDFLNAVVALDVPPGDGAAEDAALRLLVSLKAIERTAGRQRRERWGPRELDLDLLLFGSEVISVERPPEGAPLSTDVDPSAAGRLLEVPHPQMRDRLFVLAPLADVAPELVPPGWDETVEAARRRRLEVEGVGAVDPVGEWDAEAGTWVGPSGQPIVVERAVAVDADEMARIHTVSADAAYRGLAPVDPGGLERRTGMWREILADPASRSFVARDAGRIVGVLHLGPSRTGTPGELQVLYVLPAWWGSGAGQVLLDRAHRELAAESDAVLTVLAANVRARRFYERNGWRLLELVTEPHFDGSPTQVARYGRTSDAT